MAPMMHKYARDAKTALTARGFGATTDWIDFLFWDPDAPDASDYSSLRSPTCSGHGWGNGAFGLVDKCDIHVVLCRAPTSQPGFRS